MPEPETKVLNHSVASQRSSDFKPILPQESRMMSRVRKIRIICSDPYATDTDSSDDESESNIKKSSKSKRFVSEIGVPSVVIPCPKVVEPESSFQDSNNSSKAPRKKRKVLSEMPSTTTSPSKTKVKKPVGVRQRKWGKWAAEIRNPMTRVRIWLGTFSTQEEAVRAYEEKKREYDAEYGSMTMVASEKSQNVPSPAALSQSHNSSSQIHTVSSDDAESIVSHTSPSSVLDLGPTFLSNVSGGCDYFFKEEEEGFDASSLFLDIPNDLGLINEPLGSASIGKDLDLGGLEFDDLITEFGRFCDDYCGMDDLAICGGLDNNEPSELPDYDFEFGNEEFGYLDDHQHQLVNIACP